MSLRALSAKQSPSKRENPFNEHLPFKRRLLRHGARAPLLAMTFVYLFYHLALRKVGMYGKMPCLQKRQLVLAVLAPLGIIARKDIARKWLSALTAVNQPPSVIIAHSPNALPTARSNRTCKRRSSWKRVVSCTKYCAPSASRLSARQQPRVLSSPDKGHGHPAVIFVLTTETQRH